MLASTWCFAPVTVMLVRCHLILIKWHRVGHPWQALGLLRTGHLVEADRAALVAGYSGQTALKTKAVVESARIPQGHGGEFGQ